MSFRMAGASRKSAGAAPSPLAQRLMKSEREIARDHDYRFLAKNKIAQPDDEEEIRRLMANHLRAHWDPFCRQDDCEHRRECKQECAMRCGKADCTNSRMWRGEGIEVEVRSADNRGRGLFAKGNATAGDLVIEYTGRLHLKAECNKAREGWPADKKAIGYHIEFGSGGLILDPTFEGNSAKYANSSCAPNCELEKWEVNGELRYGLVVAPGKSIAPGDEVTWNYGPDYSAPGAEPMRCECDELACIFFFASAERAEYWRIKKNLQWMYLQNQVQLDKQKDEEKRARRLREREEERREQEEARVAVKKDKKRMTGEWRKRLSQAMPRVDGKENEEKQRSKISRTSNNLNTQHEAQRADSIPSSASSSLDEPCTSHADDTETSPSIEEVVKTESKRSERARRQPAWHLDYLTVITKKSETRKRPLLKIYHLVWQPSCRAALSAQSLESVMDSFLQLDWLRLASVPSSTPIASLENQPSCQSRQRDAKQQSELVKPSPLEDTEISAQNGAAKRPRKPTAKWSEYLEEQCKSKGIRRVD